MARYIQSFSTSSDVLAALSNGLNKPYVAYVEESGGFIDWNTQTAQEESA